MQREISEMAQYVGRRGKFVGYRQLRRLAWAWVEFVEREGVSLDDLYLAVRDVAGDLPYWPSERELEDARARWSEEDNA